MFKENSWEFCRIGESTKYRFKKFQVELKKSLTNTSEWIKEHQRQKKEDIESNQKEKRYTHKIREIGIRSMNYIDVYILFFVLS